MPNKVHRKLRQFRYQNAANGSNILNLEVRFVWQHCFTCYWAQSTVRSFFARYFVCKILCLTLDWTFSTLAYEISLISCPNEMKLCKNHLYSKGSGMWLRDTNRNKRLFVPREMHYLLSAYSQKSPKINPILRSGQILPALLFTLTESLAKTETDTGFQRKPASNSGQILAGHVNESKFVPWNPRTVKLMPCFRDTDSVLLLVTTVW